MTKVSLEVKQVVVVNGEVCENAMKAWERWVRFSIENLARENLPTSPDNHEVAQFIVENWSKIFEFVTISPAKVWEGKV